LVGVVLLAVSAMSSASKTYYIDEGVTFDGTSGCPAISNVNTITATLQTSLNTDSWTGSRYVDALAWPQDFWEACSTTYGSGGLDSTYADTKSLAVYAGHGNVRYLAFGQAHNGACAIDFTNNMRLGEMSGVSAAFGMWLACDVLQGSEMGSNMYQRLRQQAGWQNSISINDNEPRDFYNSTHTYTNADAWLNTMGTNFGGSRDAIISTFDSSSIANCWTAHHAAKLKDNAYTSPIGNSPACGGGQPLYYYCYEHRVSP
jgi:hypothetical protein